jgi:hypothetical protein
LVDLKLFSQSDGSMQEFFFFLIFKLSLNSVCGNGVKSVRGSLPVGQYFTHETPCVEELFIK